MHSYYLKRWKLGCCWK